MSARIGGFGHVEHNLSGECLICGIAAGDNDVHPGTLVARADLDGPALCGDVCGRCCISITSGTFRQWNLPPALPTRRALQDRIQADRRSGKERRSGVGRRAAMQRQVHGSERRRLHVDAETGNTGYTRRLGNQRRTGITNRRVKYGPAQKRA